VTSSKTSVPTYDSGCYGDGIGYYEWAKPDTAYKFEWVPVEVHNKYDPYTAWAENDYVKFDKKTPAFDFSTTFVAVTMVFALITFVMYVQAKKEVDEE
jgi:hypothetical protein